MKFRRHHNNKGYAQIRNGRTKEQVERMIAKYFPHLLKKEEPNNFMKDETLGRF